MRLGDKHSHYQHAKIKPLANPFHNAPDDKHGNMHRSALERGAEAKDERADRDPARPAQRVRDLAGEERRDGGGDEDGRHDQPVDRRGRAADVFGELLHHRHGPDDARVDAEQEPAQGAQDAGDDPGRGLLEEAGEPHVCCTQHLPRILGMRRCCYGLSRKARQ